MTLPTKETSRALTVASKLLNWLSDAVNVEAGQEFEKKVKELLFGCVASATYVHRTGKSNINHQKLWTEYHRLISCDKTRQLWKEFLKVSIAASPCATLLCSAMQHCLDELIEESFNPALTEPTHCEYIEDLTQLEENALRYAAGCVVRSYKKVKGLRMEKTLLSGLEDLSNPDEFGPDDVGTSWLQATDRGGLVHIPLSSWAPVAWYAKSATGGVAKKRQKSTCCQV